MKVKMKQEDLQQALQAVGLVIGRTLSLPILGNVLMEAGKWLDITATNLETTLTVTPPAKVTGKGSVALPARRLAAIVQQEAGEIEIVVAPKKHSAVITTGTGTYNLNGLSPDEFPPAAVLDGAEEYVFTACGFALMCERAAPAMSSDPTRYVLNGALLESTGEEFNLVASDGRRLHKSGIKIRAPKKSAIVPAVAIRMLAKLVPKDCENPLSLELDEKSAVFAWEVQDGPSYLLRTKLIDGTFPNYGQLIPSESAGQLTLPRAQLTEAISRAAVFAHDLSGSQAVTIMPKKPARVLGKDSDTGDAEVALPDLKVTGKVETIGVNPDYMQDLLRAAGEDVTVLQTSGLHAPILIEAAGFAGILMPMFVPGVEEPKAE